MAGHKGYAISFMMDVLSGVLTGSSFATDIVGPYVPDKRSGCGHLVMAINIDAIMPRAEFEERMDTLITTIKAGPTAPGAEIVVPGEMENRALGRAQGAVALPAATIAELNALADQAGVSRLTQE